VRSKWIILLLIAAGCGSVEQISNVQALERGDLMISIAQEQCINGSSNRFTILSTSKAIAGQYVVVMYPDVTAGEAEDLVARHQGVLVYAPPGQVGAFGTRMEEPQARALAAEPGVCEVYQDFFVVR